MLRTTDVHTNHVESDIDDRDRLSLYGVRGHCLYWITLMSPKLSPDIMHDVLESVATRYEIGHW